MKNRIEAAMKNSAPTITLSRTVTGKQARSPPPAVELGKAQGSISPAAQERRHILDGLLNRMTQGREAAVCIKAPRSRRVRIYRSRLYRQAFGVVDRRAKRRTLRLRPRHIMLDRLGAAMAVVAQPAGKFRD